MELADLVSLQRSTAMLGAGQKMPVDRDELLGMCSELIECRQLLARLGGDLKMVRDGRRTRESKLVRRWRAGIQPGQR